MSIGAAQPESSIVSLGGWTIRRAIYLEKKKDFGQAIQLWRRALRYAPGKDLNSRAEIHFRLGNIHLKQKNPRLAVLHFRAASNLQPSNPNALCALGRSLVFLGQFEAAKAQYQRAFNLGVINDQFYREYAWILSRKAEYSGAVLAAQRAFKINSKSEKNVAILAFCLAEAGSWESMLHVIRFWKKLNPKSRLYHSVTKFAARKYGLTLESAAWSLMCRFVQSEIKNVDIRLLQSARRMWKGFCSLDPSRRRKRAQLRITRIWAAALYGFVSSEVPSEISKKFRIQEHELKAASSLLLTKEALYARAVGKD